MSTKPTMFGKPEKTDLEKLMEKAQQLLYNLNDANGHYGTRGMNIPLMTQFTAAEELDQCITEIIDKDDN